MPAPIATLEHRERVTNLVRQASRGETQPQKRFDCWSSRFVIVFDFAFAR